MRCLWSLAFALCALGSTGLHAEPLPLTVENLSVAAKSLDPNMNWDEYARIHLETKEPQRHAMVMHSEEEMQAEVQKVKEELKAQADAFDHKRLYRLELNAAAGADPETGKAMLGIPLNFGLYGISTKFRGQGSSRFFPGLYRLLIANMDILKELQPAPDVNESIRVRTQTETGVAAYVILDFELVKVTQQQNFHVIIREVAWYNDWQRQSLVAKAVEKRDPKELVEARLLSEGITFEAAPEHAVVVGDYYMLEVLMENHPRLGTCREEPRENGHRVFVCGKEIKVQDLTARSEYRFVGGRLASLGFFALDGTGNLDALRQLILDDDIMERTLKSRSSGVGEWNFACCDFRVDVDALYRNDAKQPYYLVKATRYADLLAGKPGTEVVP